MYKLYFVDKEGKRIFIGHFSEMRDMRIAVNWFDELWSMIVDDNLNADMETEIELFRRYEGGDFVYYSQEDSSDHGIVDVYPVLEKRIIEARKEGN